MYSRSSKTIMIIKIKDSLGVHQELLSQSIVTPDDGMICQNIY
jgi:hypothetical protein